MGRFTTALGARMQYRYSYYDNGRLKEKQASDRALMWEEYPTYDYNGNMVEKRNLGGTTRYAYDVNNQLVEVLYSGVGWDCSRRGSATTRQETA